MQKEVLIFNTSVPRSELSRRFFARIGVILSTIGLLGVIFTIGTALSFLAVALYMVFLILILMLSMFVLLAKPEFMALFGEASKISEFVSTVSVAVPYILAGSAVCSVLSIILVSLDKNWSKSKSAKAVSIISLIMIALMAVALLILGKVISQQ
ncbi:MAG: hypothetical protein WCR30_04155 [Clostridia bacterium]